MSSAQPSHKQLQVGIVGATGMVGELMRSILEERGFPVETMRFVATARSAGKKIPWKTGAIAV
jgi:aspartate-semialdehyde dehydrogenase